METETTLSLDSSIADPPPTLEAPKVAPKVNFTPEKLMGMLRQMVDDGNIDRHQAAEMRRKFGISTGYFTKKKVSDEERKKKRKAAKVARRFNRSK